MVMIDHVSSNWYILGVAKPKTDKTAGWILVAAGVGVGLYFLLRPKEEQTGPGQTEAAPLPPLETPSEFPSLGAVATAFDNLKTNWQMGRIDPQPAWDTSIDLILAVEDLREAGIGEPLAADELVRQIGNLQDDISDFLQLTDVA